MPFLLRQSTRFQTQDSTWRDTNINNTFEVIISAVASFASFVIRAGSTSLLSMARAAKAITENTPAIFANRWKSTQAKWDQDRNTARQCDTTLKPAITRRAPLETAQQQSRTVRGFLKSIGKTSDIGISWRNDAWIVRGYYSGAISLRAETEASRTIEDSSASDETRTCTASERETEEREEMRLMKTRWEKDRESGKGMREVPEAGRGPEVAAMAREDWENHGGRGGNYSINWSFFGTGDRAVVGTVF